MINDRRKTNDLDALSAYEAAQTAGDSWPIVNVVG
jgi:hypothetical protein